ncbi:MAG: hypothetical protein L0H64_13015 [Pseudonocardia sp.]|nr:hypothetical protein [Pseudonocardia sp.]
MGCSHAESCPQFPLLKASLRGWRDYYCDDEIRWRECARYRMSLAGRPVPITLLPNGKDAQYLSEATAGRPATAEEARHRTPPGGGRAAPATLAAPPATGSAPVALPAPRRAQDPSQRVRVELGSGRTTGPRRGWWARLLDWTRGQA